MEEVFFLIHINAVTLFYITFSPASPLNRKRSKFKEKEIMFSWDKKKNLMCDNEKEIFFLFVKKPELTSLE